jgi:hypothetical protein
LVVDVGDTLNHDGIRSAGKLAFVPRRARDPAHRFDNASNKEIQGLID